MDIPRASAKKRTRNRRVRHVLYAVVGVIAVALVTFGVSRLKPAAPGVERSTVWIDTVKRGPMLRQVKGPGTLVPEHIRWLTADTAGRVERIHVRPGAQVEPDTVLMEL